MPRIFDKDGKPIDSPWLGNVFTVNSKGDGYNLEGNNPLGTPSTRFCVAAKYTKALFNDWSKPGVPSFALTGITEAALKDKWCHTKEYRAYNCAVSDLMLNDGDRNGPYRVMMVAQSVDAIGAAGKELLVLGKPDDGTGGLFAVDSRGISVELFMTIRATFTDVGAAMIAAR